MLGSLEWRSLNGQNYLNKFKNILDFDINFSEDKREDVKDYYYVYDLLLSCLNNDNCEVTDSTKNGIENSLIFLFSPDANGNITTEEYISMMGLHELSGTGWAPGDDDD
jgi:hypothetical protein